MVILRCILEYAGIKEKKKKGKNPFFCGFFVVLTLTSMQGMSATRRKTQQQKRKI
jgi:hypothetical protein